MSLKQMIAFTEDVGPDICEFEIECELLCNITKSFIEEHRDDFDAEDGRMLKSSNGILQGLAPIDVCPGKKADLVDCLEAVLTEFEIDEEYIGEIRDQKEQIVEGSTIVKWMALSRDLRALDLEGGIELIDDVIFDKVIEAIGTSLDRESAMKDEAFKKEAMWYLETELPYLILISEYKQESDSCNKVIKDEISEYDYDNSDSLEKPEDDITENDPNTSEKLSSTKDESIIDDNRIDTETSLCNVSFYMDKDVCSWLFNEAGGKEQTKVSMKFEDNDHFSYDIIDQPFHCEIKVKEGNIEFLLYIRTVFGIYEEENANIHIVFHGNGEKPNIIRQEGIGGDVAQTISYFVKIAVQLHKHISGTISESFAELNPEKEGMLVRIIDNDLVFNRVSGRKRPSMLCNSLFEGMHMDRPYLDEQANALAREHLTMDEKISLAEDGDPDCMEEVAQAYLNGADGVEQDFGKSAYWWEKLAETGDPSAQFNTGLFYAKGCGVERDFKKAADWMRKAAENGDDDATNLVKSYEEVQENLSKAEAGDAAAQAEIAKLYTKLGGSLEQFSTDSDYKEAFLWAKRSADQGCPEGLYCLALCYEHGRGTEYNNEKAIEAYKKAADMKHAPSQWNLACEYLRGFSIGHEVEGLILAYESAAQGYELAINGLEQSGNTVEKIIESYEDPERIITLEATQYEGRADRCERMKVGDELTYKLSKDRQGQDALELFFKGGSVGLAYQHSVGKIIALLKMNKIELKVTVRTCTPKSKRGPRARNADVTLNMILTEIRNETPEEREKRIAREAAKRKEAEEKARIEAERRRVEEEAKKKAEEENKARKRKQAESGALDLVKEARKSYKKLEENWQARFDAHQDRVSSKTFMSMDEVIRDMRRIVLDRNSYGTKYDDLSFCKEWWYCISNLTILSSSRPFKYKTVRKRLNSCSFSNRWNSIV